MNSCLEKYGVITAADREQVEKTSDIALYELKHGSISVLVIALYLTLWKNGQKVAMGSACLNALQELKENFKQSMQNLCSSDLVGAGFLIATGNEAKEPDYQKCTSSFRGGNGDFTVFCDYNAPLEKWSFVFPENWDGYYWWHFMEHLLPVDPAVCLKTLIEQGNYGESTTKKRLEKNLELPHAIFNSAFARVKPLLRKKKEMGSDPDGKEAVQYELDPEKSDEKFATHANCRRITRGIWGYFHCVVFSGSFVVAGMLGEAIKAPVWLRVLMLGGASFIAKIITEWNDRRISR